jgi:bifunctional UDP-N-acetylglucosamine pyrophosphorylase/glucosamine-1-phosphate N-acetyltransferase
VLHRKMRIIVVTFNFVTLLFTNTLAKGEGIMIHKNLQAIILAAGKSTRFNTGSSKLLAPLCGQAVVVYPARLFHELGVEVTVVTGHQKEDIESALNAQIKSGIQFVHQTEQRGTGHALMCTKDTWNKDLIIIMNGDMPFVSQEIITKLYTMHTENNAAVSFVIAPNNDPSFANYGRIVQDGASIKIVEASEFKGQPIPQEYPVNAGVYLITKDFLVNYCNALQQNNTQNEFYVTDLIGIANEAGKNVCTLTASCDDIRGINTLQELVTAEQIKRTQLLNGFMKAGVRFMRPETNVIDLDIIIGKGTVIGAGVHLLGKTKIGSQCIIHPYTILDAATLEDNVTVHPHSVVSHSTIHAHAHIGPYAHLHLESDIAERAYVGNFVEVKKSTLGIGTKAKHLAYLGDAIIGNRVNIGAGTIICNHDGKEKHTTTIKDNAYIGSNSTLIAPITIEENAYTAAGSTITNDVPESALAIGRARQIVKEGYAHKLRNKHSATPATSDQEKAPTYAYAKPAPNDTSNPEGI